MTYPVNQAQPQHVGSGQTAVTRKVSACSPLNCTEARPSTRNRSPGFGTTRDVPSRWMAPRRAGSLEPAAVRVGSMAFRPAPAPAPALTRQHPHPCRKPVGRSRHCRRNPGSHVVAADADQRERAARGADWPASSHAPHTRRTAPPNRRRCPAWTSAGSLSDSGARVGAGRPTRAPASPRNAARSGIASNQRTSRCVSDSHTDRGWIDTDRSRARIDICGGHPADTRGTCVDART